MEFQNFTAMLFYGDALLLSATNELLYFLGFFSAFWD